MANSTLPISAILFSFIAAIVTIDLRHDFTKNPIMSHAYYTGEREAPIIFHLIVPIAILISVCSLIINLVRYCKVLDFLTVLINLPALYIFVGILIPNQDALVLEDSNSDATIKYILVNRQWHLVILVINIFSILLQVLARRSEINDKSKVKIN